jgi:putative peptidoglycan lipid II flippase
LVPDAPAQRTVARSAISASAATMTSRVLGVVREVVIADWFGAGDATDAYRVAFRIPNLLRDLFAEGAMSASFVPTFTRRLTASGRNDALRLGNNVTNALLLITLTLVVLGIVFARPIVGVLVTDDYEANAGKFALTVLLARIMMPFLTFIALAAASMGMLNALQHFFVPALSPAMFNVASIACAIGLIPVMVALGFHPIAALAVGTLAGGFAQWAIQWPLLRRSGFRYRPAVDWKDEGLRRVLLLMGPGTVGLAATQVNIAVNTYFASHVTSAVSWLDYAFRLMYLPIGLFGVSIATATTPQVSRHVSLGEHEAVRRTVADSISLMLMLNVPATVGLTVLATPIVRLMYEHGQFTPVDTSATALALQCYAFGLVGYSVVRIASPTFYAFGAARTPVKVSVATVALNATLNFVLFRAVGFAGLAAGTSVAALFNASMLMFLLRRRLHGIDGRRIASAFTRIAAASALMGAAALAVDRYAAARISIGGSTGDAVRLALTIGAALVVLAGAAHVLRIEEFTRGREMVIRTLRRRYR